MSGRTAEGEQWSARVSIARWKCRIFVAIFAFSTLIVPSTVSAQEGDEPAGLDTIVSEVSFSGSALPEVLDLLATLGAVNLNPAGNLDPKIVVNLTVQTPKTIRQVLDDLAAQYSLWIDYQPPGVPNPDNVFIRPLSDKPTKADTIIEKPFPVRFNRPSEVVDLVRNFLSDRPQADALPLDAQGTIIVRDIPEALSRIEEFLNRIDIPKQSTVFPILYGDVEEIAELIRERLPDLEEGAITVDFSNSQLIVKTTLENLAEIQLLIETLDIKKEIRVFTISFHEVDEVIAVLEDLDLLSEEAGVTANEFTGRLIIKDTPERLDQIAEAIKAYDTPRPAVWVEAEILDVNASYSFGWNPTLSFGDGAQETSFGDGTSILDGDKILRLAGQNAFEFAALDAGDVLARLRASENDSDVQTVASPRIMVERGELARLNVGSEEPIGVRTFNNSVLSGSSDIVTQRSREVGIRLIIEALNISDRGYVELVIGLENSSVPPDGRIDIGGGTTGLRVLTANIETVAVLKDGRTLAVGGLVTRDVSESSGGTPFLNKVPGIRYFFSNLARADTRRKLLLFITPHIVHLEGPLDKFMQTEEDLSGEKTIGETNERLTLAGQTPSDGSGLASAEGDTQWINRGGRWGYMDESGKFVDRNDLFISAYEQGDEEIVAVEEAYKSSTTAEPIRNGGGDPYDGPSASDLLRGLTGDSGEPESPAPKPIDIEAAPKAEPATPEPSTPAPAPEAEESEPAAEQPEPEPVAPPPAPASRRPASGQPVSGEEAVAALRTPSTEMGQFNGTMRDFITKIRSMTNVQIQFSGVGREILNKAVSVDGTGKTYSEVINEVVNQQGLSFRGQKSGPPLILKGSAAPAAAPAPAPVPAPVAPAPPPPVVPPAVPPAETSPAEPAAQPDSATQPQSRSKDDPWSDPTLAAGWQPSRAQGSPRTALNPAAPKQEWKSVPTPAPISKSRSGGPVPPLEVEEWEVQREQPVPGPAYESRNTETLGTTPATEQDLRERIWDRLLDQPESTNGAPPTLGRGRHINEAPAPVQPAVAPRQPVQVQQPPAAVRPASYLQSYQVEEKEKKQGFFSKVKSFVKPGKSDRR